MRRLDEPTIDNSTIMPSSVISLFSHKPNPYSEFTISLGPAYTERLFDTMLMKNGSKGIYKMGISDRLKMCIELLKQEARKNSQKEYIFILFYTAHFYQQLAEHSLELHQQNECRESALSYYHSYLELSNGSEESRFYAQWQSGRLLGHLYYPWTITKESLLKAHSLDPLRGEPIKDMVAHCIASKRWEEVYSYPLAFAQHYLLVNAKNYFIRPLEKLEIYNLGLDDIWPIGQYWFHYRSPKITSGSKLLQGTVLALLPISFLILNIYYGISIYLFIKRGDSKGLTIMFAILYLPFRHSSG
jgi:hypothetical protein